MTFGRSEAEWLEATPAQVAALLKVHERVTNGRASGRGTRRPGTVADLMKFAAAAGG